MSGDKLGGCLVFFGGRVALKGDLIRLRHGVANLNACGEELGHVESKAVVEQREGLQRRGRVGTFRCSEGDIGEIEVVEYVDDASAGVLMIDSAAVGLRPVDIEREVGGHVVLREFIEAEAGTADGFEFHLACDGQHGVTQFLGAESTRRKAPEQASRFISLEPLS